MRDNMIRFAVYPGFVVSRNDLDTHYVSAHNLMRLYRVRPNECIVINDEHDRRGLDSEFLSRLLPLRPMAGVDYRPVSDRERAMYPLPARGER